MTLTKIQRLTLVAMFANNHVSYDDRNDRTQLALKRRGLAVFCRGPKYGRDHWSLTEAGAVAANREARA